MPICCGSASTDVLVSKFAASFRNVASTNRGAKPCKQSQARQGPAPLARQSDPLGIVEVQKRTCRCSLSLRHAAGAADFLSDLWRAPVVRELPAAADLGI